MPEKKQLIPFLKKHRRILLTLLLTAALCALLCSAGSARDRHVIRAQYDAQTHTLSVQQTVHITNRTGTVLDHLIFSLPANAYSAESTAPVPRSERSTAYPDGFAPTSVHMEQVSAADSDADYVLENAHLRIALPFPLRKNGSVTVALDYTIELAKNRLRLGFSEQDVRLGNAFATLCLHDGQDFLTDDCHAIGDPFLSACADWEVTLTAPEDFTAAGAGFLSAQEGIWKYSLHNARDFALFLSRDWHTAKREHNGVTIFSHAYDEAGAQEALDHAAQALDRFSTLFGKYPYGDFTVCAGDFYVGGMEYPGMALIDRALYGSGDGLLEFVTAHEAAHQWWYAAVGSDPIRHPWQDEALAEYSTLMYYESVYGAHSFDSLYQSLLRPATESPTLRGVGVDQSLDKFESTAVYDALIYRKGAAMLHDVRVHMGNDAFLSALRRYYEENRFAVAQPEALFRALGPDGSRVLLGWLRGEMP